MKEQNFQVIISELVRRSNEDARRLRILEQRMDAVDARISSLEDNLLDKTRKNHTTFMEIEESLRAINEEIITLKNNLDKINKQIGNFARKRDLKEIERMLELMRPQSEEVIPMEG